MTTDNNMGVTLLETYLDNATKALPKLKDSPKKRKVRKWIRKARELVTELPRDVQRPDGA